MHRCCSRKIQCLLPNHKMPYKNYKHSTRTRSNHQRSINYENEHKMTPNTLQLAKALVAPNNNSTVTCPIEERLNRRRALSRAITLIESRSVDHIHQGDLLLNYLIEARKSSKKKVEEKQNRTGEIKLKYNSQFRIGIAGSPGAGEINGGVVSYF